MEPDASHMDGILDFRDPDLGTAVASYANFSRNTSSNVLETEALALQNDFCFKCHDKRHYMMLNAHDQLNEKR